MPHILVVCTANICRSPLAEAVLRKRLQHLGYNGWVVSSAGTWAEAPRGAAHYSKKIAGTMSLDLNGHVARMVTAEIMRDIDLALCMTANHKEAIQLEFATYAPKVFMMSEMIGRNYDITDPYGGPYEGYEEMANDVIRIIDQGIERIVELAQTNQVVS